MVVLHPAIGDVVGKFRRMELHAARSGRELMEAFSRLAADSTATEAGELAAEVDQAIDALLEVLPAYAPPLNVIHRVVSQIEQARADGADKKQLQAAIIADAERYRHWSEQARPRLADYAAALIPDGATVYTFTLSETVLRVFKRANDKGRRFRVLVTESRPNNDGIQTACELAALGVPVSVSIDAAMAELIPQADLMMGGAEAIMADGSAICKVGTYPSALIARACGIKTFVLADTGKFNSTSRLGLPLPLAPLKREAVLPGAFQARAHAVGHLFDSTPRHLITGIVTEEGLSSPSAATALMRELPLCTSLYPKLEAWANRG